MCGMQPRVPLTCPHPHLPLAQGPLSRFGDTAANTGVLALLEDVDVPVAFKTVAASLGAGLFRIFLMPVDAVKTIMQVRPPAPGCTAEGRRPFR